MGNALTNAGFLDGASGWSAIVSGGVLAVDEAVRGGPGRAVLTEAGSAGVGAQVGLVSNRIPVDYVGQVWEACAGYAATSGAWSARMVWCDASTAYLADTALPQVSAPVAAAARGLPATFARGYARLAAPAGAAFATLQVQAYLGAAGPYAVAALKPYLAPAPADTRPTRWDPGVHVNPDLQLTVWPSVLPPFRSASQATPIANAKAFAGDAGIPIREGLYSGLHHEFRGEMRLSFAQWDALDAFYDATQDAEVYVVRPETDQLCIAEWLADGAPKATSVTGPWIVAEVGLHLRVA